MFLAAAAQSVVTKARGHAQKAAADDKDHVNEAAEAIDYEPLRIELEPALKKISQDAARLGLEQVGADLDALLDQVNERAVSWAKEHSAELVTGLDETTKDLVRTLTTEALEQGWSNDRLADELEDSEAFSEARAERIARTETAFADVQGNVMGWRESGLVESKQWILGNNSCDECQALADEIVPLDEPFSNGDDAPPAHPNCVCDVVPITSDDEDAEKLQKFPGQPRDSHGRFGSGGEPSRKQIARGLKSARFNSLLAGNKPGSMPVALIEPKLASALGTRTKTVLLSRDTVKKNRAHHPEVSADLWRETQTLVDKADLVVRQDRNGTVAAVFINQGEKEIYLAMKVTRKRHEIYATSLRYSSPEERESVMRRGTVIRGK